MEISLAEAAPRLEELVDRALEGHEVILTEDGEPVARLVPVTSSPEREAAQTPQGPASTPDKQ